MAIILIVFVLSIPLVACKGSHSLWIFMTYIKGQTAFPEFSNTVMLDDITVGYFDSNTKIYIPRGNTTDESDVIDPEEITKMYGSMLASFEKRSNLDLRDSHGEGLRVYQKLIQCKPSHNSDPGLMITRNAARGVTTDELRLLGNSITYHGTLNISEKDLKVHLDWSKQRIKNYYYPACIKALQIYLKKRESQLMREILPVVKLFQKPRSASGGSCVSCLATRFYPRDINLTLFRDCRPVADHEITGGDLLPNDDGTYQMRKSLEISAEEERKKHKYTCSVSHINLDNKIVVSLDNILDRMPDCRPQWQLVLIGVGIGVLVLVLVCVIVAIVRRGQAGRLTPTDLSKNDYNAVPVILGNSESRIQ